MSAPLASEIIAQLQAIVAERGDVCVSVTLAEYYEGHTSTGERLSVRDTYDFERTADRITTAKVIVSSSPPSLLLTAWREDQALSNPHSAARDHHKAVCSNFKGFIGKVSVHDLLQV
jgi:hypothetical protein